jgi:hypothetical protein
MSIKNIAPDRLDTHQVGGEGDNTFTTGELRVDNAGRTFIRAKLMPDTGSVTGSKGSFVAPSSESDVWTPGEYCHDLSDSASALQSRGGITQFSRMTAVTHYGWVQVKGEAKHFTSSTDALWVDGAILYVSTTDKILRPLNVASTGNAVTAQFMTKVGIALADNVGMTTGTTVSIFLDGIGY